MKKFDYTFKALGTICIISIIQENDDGLNKIVNSCYDMIINFENEFSRFKNDSILSKLNIEKKLEVSDDFLNLIIKSREIYSLSKGYFNPLIDVRKIGYSHSFDENKFEILDIKENLDFKNVKNYGNLLEIDENMTIDFGSIAKGFLADKVGNYLKSKGFTNFLVNLGGDIVVSGFNAYNKPWSVGISNPDDIQDIIYSVNLTNKSISTSGIYLRNWQINDKTYHHIRNPFSNKQSTKLKSVSIVDYYGYKTDALATAIIAMGYDLALDFCKANKISFIFVLEDLSIIKSDDL